MTPPPLSAAAPNSTKWHFQKAGPKVRRRGAEGWRGYLKWKLYLGHE